MEKSKKYSLNSIDFKKIGKGALIALAGALLTYVTETLGHIDFGTWTPLVVSMNSVIVNAASRWLVDFSKE